jgi:hypothetical protein
MTDSVSLGTLDRSVPSGSHICAFVDGPDGRDDIVLPFLAEDMVAYWRQAATQTETAGEYGLTRATGEMPPVLDHPDGRTEFFRYEATLNDVIPGYPLVVLCLYDLKRFGAEVLMDTLRTHPMVIVDGMIHDIPYFIEPGMFAGGTG